MSPPDSDVPAQLSLCVFAEPPLADALQARLSPRYQYYLFDAAEAFLSHVEQHRDTIDCLILQNVRSSLRMLNHLYSQGALLPIVIIEPAAATHDGRPAPEADPAGMVTGLTPGKPTARYLYHTGEVWLLATQLEDVTEAIERAIARFLKLSPPEAHPATAARDTGPPDSQLRSQQRRLADKLKERLGYLGVYYKRNPQDFFRHLPPPEKTKLLTVLRDIYREIILNYFTDDYPLNQVIDRLVNQVFFADLSVSQVLEIHMELMDEFAQQLKLEGRSDEILIDYRLALIDIIAHLCEMYRRSIPREELPYEVFIRDE